MQTSVNVSTASRVYHLMDYAGEIARPFVEGDNSPEDKGPATGSVSCSGTGGRDHAEMSVKVNYEPVADRKYILNHMDFSLQSPERESKLTYDRIPGTEAQMVHLTSTAGGNELFAVMDQARGICFLEEKELPAQQPSVMAAGIEGAREGMPAPGSALHPEMIKKALAGGYKEKNLVKDAEELRNPAWSETAGTRGFTREKDHEGCRIYATEHAYMYGTGQRAILSPDGAVQLVTFVERWIQFTNIDAEGKIQRNEVIKLP